MKRFLLGLIAAALIAPACAEEHPQGAPAGAAPEAAVPAQEGEGKGVEKKEKAAEKKAEKKEVRKKEKKERKDAKKQEKKERKDAKKREKKVRKERKDEKKAGKEEATAPAAPPLELPAQPQP